MLQILAATTNKHKIREFQAMLDASADSGRVCIISPDTIKGEKVATKLIGQVAKFLAPLM